MFYARLLAGKEGSISNLPFYSRSKYCISNLPFYSRSKDCISNLMFYARLLEGKEVSK